MRKTSKAIFGAFFPFFANCIDNKIILKRLDNSEKKNESSNIGYIRLPEICILKELLQETFDTKDKFEDKAKSCIVGITIAITLIMGVSNLLDQLYLKYTQYNIHLVSALILFMSVVYFLIAGILAIKVLFSQNITHTVTIASFSKSIDSLKKEYFDCIERNNDRNLIRNNTLFSSYECIRNALICLVIFFAAMILPI